MPESSWFLYSLFATICFGVGGALMKMPAARNQNRFVMAFWSVGFPFLLSLIVFWNHLSATTSRLVWLAIIWALFFSVVRILYIQAFHYADTNVVTPVTNTINIILTVASGLLIFSDRLSVLEFFGILLAFATLTLFAFGKQSFNFSRNLLLLFFVISICSVGYKIFQKIGVDAGDLYAFQILQFGFATVFLFLLFAFFHRNEIAKWHSHLRGPGIISGCMMGLLSFAGGISYNIALSRGEFTLVNAIHSMYLPVTIFTGYLLFHEQFTKRKALLLFLAICSIVLIRLG